MSKNETLKKDEAIDVEVVDSKKKSVAIKGADNSIEGLISQGISQNMDVATMKELMAMRKEYKADIAKEAFDKAMSKFQGECPAIKKTKEVVNKGVIMYSYAPIDSIVTQVKPFLTKNEFSYSVKTETNEKSVKATCIAKHALGHTDESSMDVPLGGKTGIMSDSQVVAAALTFAKRYAFCNVFGIMTSDQDDEKVLSQDNQPAKDTTNYLELLKSVMIEKGATDTFSGVEIFNKLTGYTIKGFPANNGPLAKELYNEIINLPIVIKE